MDSQDGARRAAIYARYSSELQRETSIEDQVRLCREEAHRRGYVVVATWEDREVSGQINDRPGLRAMLAAAERGDFDVLLLDDVSRLSRDTADALGLLKRLRFWGVGLVARADSIDTLANPKAASLLYSVKSMFAEEFLRDLGEKTRRGLEGQVRRGFSPGGSPYGYRSAPVGDPASPEGYRLVVHPSEAAVVRKIFELRVGIGEWRPLSLREIATRLNADRVPPPGARWRNRTARQCATWSYTAVRGILLNPLYTGRVVWNRTEWVRHPDTRRRLRRRRPPDDWVERRDESLRIVPDELWQAAQARTAAARLGVGVAEYRTRGRAKYLLSGFIQCGVCGAHYVMANRVSYRCASSRNRGPLACSNDRSISRRRLERAVVAALRDHLYRPETVEALVAAVREALLRRATEQRRRADLEAQAGELVRLEREIANIKEAVALGRATRTLLEMLEEREARRADLLARAGRSGEDPGARVTPLLEHLPALVREAIEALEEILGTEQVDKGKELLARLVEGIILRPSGRGLEAEIRGAVQGLLKLAPPGLGPGVECNFVGSGGRI